jgi:hypothetical protein
MEKLANVLPSLDLQPSTANACTAERQLTKIRNPSFVHGRAPTQRDRLCFLAFRTMVGSIALGLSILFTVFTVAPLVVEAAIEAPPAPPPTAWALWSEHDAEASRMILLISSVQATLIACFFLWYQFSYSTRKDEAAAKARRIDQRTRDRRKLLSRKASGGGSTGGAPREGDTGDGDADSSAIAVGVPGVVTGMPIPSIPPYSDSWPSCVK